MDQLVEVAVRALSPGVNDPSTAITCIEWLGAALIQMAERNIPSRWRYDEDGKLRVITDATDFEGIAASALNQVRQYGCSSVAVTVRLLDVLARIGPHLVRENDRVVLLTHARSLRDDGLADKERDHPIDIAAGARLLEGLEKLSDLVAHGGSVSQCAVLRAVGYRRDVPCNADVLRLRQAC